MTNHNALYITKEHMSITKSSCLELHYISRFYIWMDDCAGRAMMIAFSAEDAFVLVFDHLNRTIGNIKHVDRTDWYALITLYALLRIDGNLLKLIFFWLNNLNI